VKNISALLLGRTRDHGPASVIPTVPDIRMVARDPPPGLYRTGACGPRHLRACAR